MKYVFFAKIWFVKTSTRIVKYDSRVVKLNPVFKKMLYSPFLWMGFNCLKATEPLHGGSLLFITKFPEIPSTHLVNLRKMKG